MNKNRAVLKQDLKAWQKGLAAGKGLKANCPYPTRSVEAWSWQSGYIEGKAERLKLNSANKGKS
jgi:hypothetical protein